MRGGGGDHDRRSRACGPVGSESYDPVVTPEDGSQVRARCRPILPPACKAKPRPRSSIHRRGCGRCRPRGASRAVYGKRLNQAAARPAPPITSTSPRAANSQVTSCSSSVNPTVEPRSRGHRRELFARWRREEPASGRVGDRSERRLVRRDRHRLGDPERASQRRPCLGRAERIRASARRRPLHHGRHRWVRPRPACWHHRTAGRWRRAGPRPPRHPRPVRCWRPGPRSRRVPR